MARLGFGAFLAPHHPIGENPLLQFRRDIAFVKHIEDIFDHQTAGLAGARGNSKADSSGHLWFALAADLFRHQFQQIRQVQIQRTRQAFQHFR